MAPEPGWMADRRSNGSTLVLQCSTVKWTDTNEADDWKPDRASGIVGIATDPYVNTGKTWSTMDPLTGRGKTVFWVNKCTAGECPRALVPPTQTGLNYAG